MGMQSWGHRFPLAQAAHLCTTERYQHLLGGKRWVWLTLSDMKQIKYEAGRQKDEREENESNIWNFLAVLCMKELVKDGVFPFSLLLQRKKKKPQTCFETVGFIDCTPPPAKSTSMVMAKGSEPLLQGYYLTTWQGLSFSSCFCRLVLDACVASLCFTSKVCTLNFCFIYLFEVFSLWESLHTPHRPNISSFFVIAEHLTEKHSVWRRKSCVCQFIQLTHSILSVTNPPALRLIHNVHKKKDDPKSSIKKNTYVSWPIYSRCTSAGSSQTWAMYLFKFSGQ